MSKGLALALLMASLVISGCLQIVEVQVKGDALEPTISVDRGFFTSLVVSVYDPAERYWWRDVWLISEKAGEEAPLLKEVTYGRLPEGYEELANRGPLKPGNLYSVGLYGGPFRGSREFALVQTEEGTLIEYLGSWGSTDLVEEYTKRFGGPEAVDRPYVRAQIYLIVWDVDTRSEMTPEDVRRLYDVRVSVEKPSEVEKLIRFLRLEEMQPRKAASEEDARLVVDLFRADNTKTTYYASYSKLLSADSQLERTIGSDFRDIFAFPGSP